MQNVEDLLAGPCPRADRRQAAIRGHIRRAARDRHARTLEMANAINSYIAARGAIRVACSAELAREVRLAMVRHDQLYLSYGYVDVDGHQYGASELLHIEAVTGELADLLSGLDDALASVVGVLTQGARD